MFLGDDVWAPDMVRGEKKQAVAKFTALPGSPEYGGRTRAVKAAACPESPGQVFEGHVFLADRCV
jgi:hypothetical protein